MNKYQEALDYINTLICCSCEEPATEKGQPCKNCSKIKKIDILEELVDKQTPKKVIGEDIGYDLYKNENQYAMICPHCGEQLLYFTDGDFEEEEFDLFINHFNQYYDIRNWQHCGYCGQALDWKLKNGHKGND